LAHSFHTMTMVPPTVTDWVAYSGASNHTTSSAGNLTSIRPPLPTDPSSIIVGNGSSLMITSVGNTTLHGMFYSPITSLLLPTIFIISYVFVVSLPTIGVLCSLSPLAFL
jgi:hypothetical protein